MTVNRWLWFVLTLGVLAATPGPAVLFVLSQAIRNGARKSVWAACGILSANAGYFALSATSLGAIIVASYRVFFLIKWIGAGYLVWLGLKCFFSNRPAIRVPESNRAHSSLIIWRDGIVLQGANPKALLFFTAILPQFIDSKNPLGPQLLIFGLSAIVIEFLILVLYGHLASRAALAIADPRFGSLTNRVSGALLVGAGVGLARLKRA